MKRMCKRTKSKSIRTLFFIFIFAVLTPANYLGKSITPKPISSPEFQKWHKTQIPLQHLPTVERHDDDREQPHFEVPILLSMWTLCILLVSSILLGGILAYFNDQPLNRQCLLLYLYKDVIKLVLVKLWVLSGSMILYKSSRNGTFLEKHHANIISSIELMLTLGIALSLNCASFLKLYITASKLNDPIVAHYGYDDETTIRNLRCLNSGLIISFLLLIFWRDVHPITFYTLQGIQRDFMDWPAGSLAIIIILCSLLLTWIVSHITTKFLEHRSLTNNTNCPSFGHTETGCCNEDRAQDQNVGNGDRNAMPTRPHIQQISLPAILSPALFTALGITSFVLVMVVNKSEPWIIMLAIQHFSGVFLPILIIWNNNSLKAYLKRTMSNRTTPILHCFKTIWNSFKCPRRSAIVEPIL